MQGKNNKMSAKRIANLAMLTGIALIIFVVELQIPNPFPIPGIKLGLANIVTVYAVYHYRAYDGVCQDTSCSRILRQFYGFDIQLFGQCVLFGRNVASAKNC